MPRTKHLILSSALALTLVFSSPQSANAMACVASNTKAEITTATGQINSALLNMQQLIVMALLGVPAGGPGNNISAAITALTETNGKKARDAEIGGSVHKQTDDKKEIAKSSDEIERQKTEKVNEKTLEATKEHTPTIEDCARATRKIADEVDKVINIQQVRAITNEPLKWMDGSGAPNGAAMARQFNKERNKASREGGDKAASYMPPVMAAEKCSTPECYNLALQHEVQGIIAQNPPPRRVPVDEDEAAIRTEGLIKYDKAFWEWQARYAKAIASVRSIMPDMRRSLQNYETARGLYAIAYQNTPLNPDELLLMAYPNSNKSGLSKFDLLDIAYDFHKTSTDDIMNVGNDRGAKVNAANNFFKIKEEYGDAQKKRQEFEQALETLRSDRAPVASAGDLGTQTKTN